MISMLAFAAAEPAGLDTVEQHLRHFLKDLAELQRDESAGYIHAKIGTEEALIAPKRAPIPWSLLAAPCEGAWYWSDAAATLKAHGWHLVVLLKESAGDPIHKSMLLSRLAAELGERLEYVGVYWDGATMVHSAQAFTESVRAMSLDHLPLRLWINFRVLRNADGTSTLFTRGLDVFHHLEIEIRNSRADRETLLNWSYNIAHFLLDRGSLLEDGDTVGHAGDERRITVHRAPSMFDASRQVLTLEI